VADLVNTYVEQGVYVPVTGQMLTRAEDIMHAYDFQLFDSIIIASALETGCTLFYSEDMSDGQIIEKQLKIVNPFKL
jgi:predicted nucleic acid-binding protein